MDPNTPVGTVISDILAALITAGVLGIVAWFAGPLKGFVQKPTVATAGFKRSQVSRHLQSENQAVEVRHFPSQWANWRTTESERTRFENTARIAGDLCC